jgi:hypothetical protein
MSISSAVPLYVKPPAELVPVGDLRFENKQMFALSEHLLAFARISKNLQSPNEK